MKKIDINNINPYIRIALNSVFQKGTVIKRRVIFDYELIYISKGSFTLCFNDIDYVCSKGQFILIRPNIPHSFSRIKGELGQPHIHFDLIYNELSREIPISFKDFNELSPKEQKYMQTDIFENYPKTPFVKFSNTEKVLELFFDIISGYNEATALECKGKLTQIINMLILENFPDCFKPSEAPNTEVCKQIKDYIDAAQGMNMSLCDFADQFSYNKFYLERKFKSRYNTSIITYRNNKRMEFACEALAKYSVSETAQRLGFSSIYAFSRAFKNYYGINPTEYKNTKKPLV